MSTGTKQNQISNIKEDMDMSTLEKIEKAVVDGYKNIEEKAVNTVQEMAEDVKYAYDKVEDAVVGKFEDITDSFIEKHLMKEGETLEEAKERIAKEQEDRMANIPKYDHEAAMKAQKERIEKSIEASKNAGKR